MITREHTQEALSWAHVHALAGRAGVNVERATLDYGIDGTFWPVKKIKEKLIQNGHPIVFQIKSTTKWTLTESDVVYDLDARAHVALTSREPSEPMAILILLCLPQDDNLWYRLTEKALFLRNCCFWMAFNEPPTQNASSIRIRIPRSNILDPQALRALLTKARAQALEEPC
ncbi:DUF4365 domain-containing protein [Chthonobacter rhizosphaerae]|uniref:DUF4365 domain-containing protein n=1 Tax=Chthonobacter rhizosphaerae TaxID=2735553 RepID=UPI0015EF8807